jgi:hypothetical protein
MRMIMIRCIGDILDDALVSVLVSVSVSVCVCSDPTLFEDAESNIHMLFHGYQWHGLWTGMHAYSTDGGNSFALSQRRDGRGAFSTNQTCPFEATRMFMAMCSAKLRVQSALRLPRPNCSLT